MGVFVWNPSAPDAARLAELLRRATGRPGGPDWYDLPTTVRNRHPDGIRAIVGYGSWYVDGLRKPQSFPDVYLVVDDYDRFHQNGLHVWWNRTIPPNVYFVWSEGDGHRDVRGKYNVISATDLERECGPYLRDVYNAGRMTKRLWIAWVRDEGIRAWLIDRLVAAHCTLAPLALALLPERFTALDFSHELLGLSYRGEPRLEGWERVRALYDADPEHYGAVHHALLDAFAAATGMIEIAAPDEVRKRDGDTWRGLRYAAWRLLRRSRRRGFLRWPRIVMTEANLVDLAVSEAERKAGVRIRVTPELRRHPFLFGLPEFLRVLRERNTRERISKRPGAPR
jgi:hypothetical protein